ncbi:g5479 [Coccomyxa elongata]
MQDINTFRAPKIELEQYPTGPEIASRMLFTIQSVHDEFEGQTVVDLGCGTGMLGIGAALLGSSHVIGVDIDSDALETAQGNLESFEDVQMELLQCDIMKLERQPRLQADTVITNPPFGTRRKGADLDFLRAAFRISRGAVYSLHKSSTRAHVQRVAERELSAAAAEVIAQLRYDLPASYAFHRERSKDIEVDLWRFEVPPHR